jgi:RNA polymerase sigma factor (sigma-70 family)
VSTLQDGPTDSISDGELVRRARDGDNAAFGDIFHRYWKQVYVAAFTRLYVDRDAARDAAAEVFLGAFRNGFKKYEDGTPLRAWLLQSANWRALDQVRGPSRNYRLHYTAAVPDEPGPDSLADDITSEEHLEWLCRELAQHLNEDEHKLFDLFLLETCGELTRAETAAQLGWSTQYTATRVKRLRDKLQLVGAAISLVNNGDRKCTTFNELVPGTGQPPASWPDLMAHVKGCRLCGRQGRKLFRAAQVLPAIAIAMAAAAQALRAAGTTATTAALSSPLVALLELLGPASAPAAKATDAAPSVASGGVGTKLAVAGGTVAGVITALILLAPGLPIPQPLTPGAAPTASAAPPLGGPTMSSSGTEPSVPTSPALPSGNLSTAPTDPPAGNSAPVIAPASQSNLRDLTGGMSLVFTNMSWLPNQQRAWAIQLNLQPAERCPTMDPCYTGAPWYAEDGSPSGHIETSQFVLSVRDENGTLRVDGTDKGGQPPDQHYNRGLETGPGTLTFVGTFIETSTNRTADFKLTSCVAHPNGPACNLLLK